MRYSLLIVTLLAPVWAADTPTPQLDCGQSSFNIRGMVSVCRMSETTLAFAGSLGVTTPVGGVSVVGWDQPDVLVRARIEAAARTRAEAETLDWEVQATVVGNQVAAEGPGRGSHWAVTFEIFVPHAIDLTVAAKVGGISIADVSGEIRFTAAMGGVSLKRLAGDAQGSTNMGGVAIELVGDHWDGKTLAVTTAMGGIDFHVPAGYSAHFTLSTSFGKINVQGLGTPAPTAGAGFGFSSALTFDAGSGGATISAGAHLGGIAIHEI